MEKGKLLFDFFILKLYEYIKIIKVYVNIFFFFMYFDKFLFYVW